MIFCELLLVFNFKRLHNPTKISLVRYWGLGYILKIHTLELRDHICLKNIIF